VSLIKEAEFRRVIAIMPQSADGRYRLAPVSQAMGADRGGQGGDGGGDAAA